MNASGPLSLKGYAKRIGVKAGTVRRWRLEGMPVDVDDVGAVEVNVALANEWVRRHRQGSVAFYRRPSIYVAKSEAGPVKVGFTSDVERRLCEVSRGPFGKVRLVARFAGDKPVELRIHAELHDLHIEDEWFRDDPRILDVASQLAKPPRKTKEQDLSGPQQKLLTEAASAEWVSSQWGATSAASTLVRLGLLRRAPRIGDRAFVITDAGRLWLRKSPADHHLLSSACEDLGLAAPGNGGAS